MLCWICPDCGRDCSPAVRECPFCAQQAPSPVTGGVIALVEKLQEAPSVPLLEAGSQQYLLFGLSESVTTESVTSDSLDGPASTAVSTLTLAGEDVQAPTGEAIDSVVRQLVESAKTAAEPPPEPDQKLRVDIVPHAADSTPVKPPALLPTPLPPAIDFAIKKPTVNGRHESLATQPPLAPNAKFMEFPVPVDAFGRSVPAMPLDLAPAPRPPVKPALLLPPSAKFVELPAPIAPPPDIAPAVKVEKPAAVVPPIFSAPPHPEPVAFSGAAVRIARRPNVAVVRIAKTSPLTKSKNPALSLPPATTSSISEAEGFAARPIRLPELAPATEPLAAAIELAARAGAITTALEIQAETLLTEIAAEIEARESAIRTIAATFAAMPACPLLPVPREIVTAPADPDFTWKKTPRPAISARKPPFLKYASLTAPPQKLPLAGPCLPPELQNFILDTSAEAARRYRRIGTPAWILSLVIATSLFLGAGTLIQHLLADRDAKSQAVTNVTHRDSGAGAPAAAFEPHPFARFVEVTGLRVVADLNHRSQVQYIVVNHSSAELTGMALRIAVRSSKDPADAPPLFTVSAIVPSLAPHQSKEIRTDLDSELRASAIPDWEYLRTDVQVGSAN